ncbi:hypothetical protein D9M71_632250 [compost metagenome]
MMRSKRSQTSRSWRIDRNGASPVPVASSQRSRPSAKRSRVRKPKACLSTISVSPSCRRLNSLVNSPPGTTMEKNSRCSSWGADTIE